MNNFKLKYYRATFIISRLLVQSVIAAVIYCILFSVFVIDRDYLSASIVMFPLALAYISLVFLIHYPLYSFLKIFIKSDNILIILICMGIGGIYGFLAFIWISPAAGTPAFTFKMLNIGFGAILGFGALAIYKKLGKQESGS